MSDFAKSSLLSDLNGGRYLDAASSFLLYDKSGGKVLPGLTRRRKAEKDLFLSDGVPNEAGELQKNEQEDYFYY